MEAGSVTQKTVVTKIPARMDRLPWTRWHWFVVFSLGIVWVLDGLEVTIKGAVGPSLRESLDFTTVAVAGSASIYLVGAVTGALTWGYLTDRLGRQKIFMATIAVYMTGVLGTAFTGVWIFGSGFEYVWFAVFRFLTGFGIGGEYAAIHSAIDELIPARVRGWVDLAISGSYWIGTMFGSVAGAIFLDVLPPDLAFRFAFGLGLLLGLGILLLRYFVPESPRWLMTHGREEEAEETVREIEANVKGYAGVDELREPDDSEAIELRERRAIGFIELGRTLFKLYPARSAVGFTLLLTQAFLYNAIFFTYGLMLTTFFGVSNSNVGWFLIPFAVGNFLGPLILGRLFDTVGRKVMIPLTFLLAAVLTIAAGLLFATGVIGAAWVMTLSWVIIFFFASAGASAAYLTISETFPLEVRAMAIAFFYAIATGIGGVIGPILYGTLITGGRWSVFWGYVVGAVLMATGGIVHRMWGVEAAQRGLESVAMPLSVSEAGEQGQEPQALNGPAGVDVGDPESVRHFQREHGLRTDGLLGPETAGALREGLSRSGDGGRVSVVDAADANSIKRFQLEYGLEPDGVIGPRTRGAIRAAERRDILDPSDEESVRRFQRRHLLTDDGVVGPGTQAALRSIRAEHSGQPEGYLEPRVLDPEEVRHFQRACGLEPDGVVGPETAGAIRSERARWARSAAIDPADAGSIRRLQQALGLEADGTVGPQTRDEIARLRKDSSEAPDELRDALEPRRTRFGVDPADSESVQRLQREVGLEPDGCIGPETRRALRRLVHLLVDVDPTDTDSVRRFQREQGLTVDGVIGDETRGALRARQNVLAGLGREEESELDEEEPEPSEPTALIAFNPADREAVERFQREHGLEADGVIGPQTQAALRAAFADQEQELMRRPARDPARSGRSGRPVPRPPAGGYAAGLPTLAAFPGEDSELPRELEQVVAALRRRPQMSRDELRHELNARLWGPGRLRYVLRTAEEEGVVRRSGRDRYALPAGSRDGTA